MTPRLLFYIHLRVIFNHITYPLLNNIITDILRSVFTVREMLYTFIFLKHFTTYPSIRLFLTHKITKFKFIFRPYLRLCFHVNNPFLGWCNYPYLLSLYSCYHLCYYHSDNVILTFLYFFLLFHPSPYSLQLPKPINTTVHPLVPFPTQLCLNHARDITLSSGCPLLPRLLQLVPCRSLRHSC